MATVRAASQRRVAAAMASQTSPCSPSAENLATARSETDAVVLGLDAQVDDLGEVERHVRVAGVEVVEALVALDRLPQALVRGLLEPEREHLPAGEADVDLRARVGHQCAGS